MSKKTLTCDVISSYNLVVAWKERPESMVCFPDGIRTGHHPYAREKRYILNQLKSSLSFKELYHFTDLSVNAALMSEMCSFMYLVKQPLLQCCT
jgi:hypothetical protein